MNYFYSRRGRNGNLVSAVQGPHPYPRPVRANHGYHSCYWEAWDVARTATAAKELASPPSQAVRAGAGLPFR